jgi:predicted Rossmann fold nucleotide-binding protein DprA/Smf involved in DNA uptake
MRLHQFDLFVGPSGHAVDEATRARRDDPPTSKVAATRTKEFDANHFGRIMLALRAGGPKTFHEIATWAGMDGQQINKRLPELERMGAVERTGETRPSPSGRQCAVWRAIK